MKTSPGSVSVHQDHGAHTLDGTLIALAPQVTNYVYSGDLDPGHLGSPVPRSDLLRATIYPDSKQSVSDVVGVLNGGSGSRDFVQYTYLGNGAQATKTDQRGIVHTYAYDDLGRVTEDRATAPGGWGDVDHNIQSIRTDYTDAGQTAAITSWGDADENGTLDVVRNQIAYTYDGWGNVLTSRQASDGEVSPTSPTVEYTYGSLGLLTSVRDPSGRVTHYTYGTLAGQAGQLDPLFGDGGKVTTNITGIDGVNNVAIQPDGKIVVAGTVWASGASLGLARYNTDGSLDTSFDTDGMLIANFSSGYCYVTSMAVQSNGGIVVLVEQGFTGTGYRFLLVRYNTDGTQDTNFGMVIADFNDNPNDDDYFSAMTIQSDDKIVLVGWHYNGIASDFGVVRYNSDGSLDTSFDTDGRVTTDLGGSDVATAVAIQPDGKIVVAGTTWTGGGSNFALARYNTTGSLDTSFDTDGIVTTDCGETNEGAVDLMIQAGGKIVVAGHTDSSSDPWVLLRYKSNGSLDTSFGTGGEVTTNFSADDTVLRVALQSDGKIIIAGIGATLDGSDFVMSRYNADGIVDAGFGTDGKVTTAFNDLSNGAMDVKINVQADGKIVLAGWSGSDFALARYLPGMSRLTAIQDDNGGVPGQTLVQYTYLGAGTIIGESHPGVENGLDLTLGTYDNDYAGLDQWGRVVDQVWKNGGVTCDEYKYDYDAAGNRTYRQNVLADAAGKDLSETYLYDEVYRLIGTQRGKFTSGVFTGTDYQDWTLDGMGNFAEFNDDGTSQTRQTDAANQISAISGATNQPTYDAAGNLSNDDTLKYVYDAWNRQVEVKKMDNTSLATYEFDGLNRRIQKNVTTAGGGSESGTRDYYYNENWQVLEERQTVTGQANPMVTQYVWDQSYIDTPVARFRDADGNGTFEQKLYYMADANHNVTGLVDASTGNVVERYVYQAYGKVTVYSDDWDTLADDGSDPNATGGDESAFGNEILYSGYRYDPETAVADGTAGAMGNYQVRNREYITSISTFDVRDPWGYAAGDANLYRYVSSNPINASDSLGCSDQTDIGIGVVQRLGPQLVGHVLEAAQIPTALAFLEGKFDRALGELDYRAGTEFEPSYSWAKQSIDQLAAWALKEGLDYNVRRPRLAYLNMVLDQTSQRDTASMKQVDAQMRLPDSDVLLKLRTLNQDLNQQEIDRRTKEMKGIFKSFAVPANFAQGFEIDIKRQTKFKMNLSPEGFKETTDSYCGNILVSAEGGARYNRLTNLGDILVSTQFQLRIPIKVSKDFRNFTLGAPNDTAGSVTPVSASISLRQIINLSDLGRPNEVSLQLAEAWVYRPDTGSPHLSTVTLALTRSRVRQDMYSIAVQGRFDEKSQKWEPAAQVSIEKNVRELWWKKALPQSINIQTNTSIFPSDKGGVGFGLFFGVEYPFNGPK